MTFTFVGSGQVDALSPDTTDVLFRALVHICTPERTGAVKPPTASREAGRAEPAGLADALGSAVLHHVFVALATEAFEAAVRVDAVASAVATRFQVAFIIVWTTRDSTTKVWNIV